VEASEHNAADVHIVRKLPPLLTALQDNKYQDLDEDSLNVECIKIFQELAVDEHEVQYLDQITVRMFLMAQVSHRSCHSIQVWTY